MNGQVISLVAVMLVLLTAPAKSSASTNILSFVAMTPCRVVDTRMNQGFSGAFGAPPLAGGASRTFPMQSSATCAIPAAAQAYSLNITVVPPGPLGFITAYPTGEGLPLAATVNSPQGFIVGNAAIVPGGTNGSIDVYASNPTDIVVDINGYYVPGSGTSDPLVTNTNLGSGAGAMLNNTTESFTGGFNTALGYFALTLNTIGAGNVALGYSALVHNTTGSNNVGVGGEALVSNTTGFFNTAFGFGALGNNTTGSYNIGIGASAASRLLGGDNNVYIGNSPDILTTENNTIRITGATGMANDAG